MGCTQTTMPATGLSAHVLRERSRTAPVWGGQGTAVPFAGSSTAQVAVLGARVIDLPGLPPRGAPV